MPVKPMPHPQHRVTVTHGAVDHIIITLTAFVRRKENGFDTGTALVEDTYAYNYAQNISVGDAIKIEAKDDSETSWTTLLDGVIRSVDPILSATDGNLLKLECDGAGYGVEVMRCGEEYGTDSAHSGLDTIKEIIEDNNNGIIDKWVNKILGSATDSGFGYTTQVEDVAGTIGYYYSPFKPSSKAINDVCDIVQAIKGANAGPHWIVDASNRFLLATIGSHGAPASTFWGTYYRVTQAQSTLTEGMDFIEYRFHELAKEANYVLYHGDVVKPLDLDWAEGNSASWDDDGNCAVADDAVLYQIGSGSIKVTMDNAAGASFEAWYPSTMDLGLDIDALGGKYSVPIARFWMMMDTTFWGDTDNKLWPTFYTSANDYFKFYDLGYTAGSSETRNLPKDDEFYELTFPIGPNWNIRPEELPTWLNIVAETGAPDWTDINAVGVSGVFDNAAHGSDIWVDGIYIKGTVLRAARQNAAYSSADPCKMKLITDSVAKDDTLNATDDSGLIGRLTYAEYLRCSTTPIVGSFTVPLAPEMLPGQLIHVHAKKKRDGTYAVDKDFRVLRLTHNIGKDYTTAVEVSDDLKNANPRPVPNQYNVLMNAVRPEAQDRQASSIKLRDIDITQSILEKSY